MIVIVYTTIIDIVSVVKANEPNLLKEHGDHLELTDDWGRHLLKLMEWESSHNQKGRVIWQIFVSRKFSYQYEILRAVLDHDIPLS